VIQRADFPAVPWTTRREWAVNSGRLVCWFEGALNLRPHTRATNAQSRSCWPMAY